MSILTPRIRVVNNAGNTIVINNDWDIIFQTNITNDIAAGTNQQFAVNSIFDLNTVIATGTALVDLTCYIGNLGNQTVEATNNPGVSFSNNSFTVSTTFAHNRGEAVQFVSFNRIALFKNGTLLTTLFMQPTRFVSTYKDILGLPSDTYTAQFLNTQNAVTNRSSQLSLPVSAISLDTTAGYIIDSVRAATGNIQLSDDFFVSALNDARKIVDTDFSHGYLWEWRQKFNHSIRMVSGKNYIQLPADIDFTNTNRSILNVRYTMNVASGTIPLRYIDKANWNTSTWKNNGLDVISYNGTQLVLSNTADLPDTGSVTCSAINSTGTMTIAYTTNSITTNTLGGLTGNVRTINAGDQVWSNANYNQPTAYTIFAGRLWFNSVIPNILNQKSVLLDYFTRMTLLADINDTLPEHYRDVYKHYLMFATKRRRNDTIGKEDPDYKQFIDGLSLIVANNSYNNDIRITNG